MCWILSKLEWLSKYGLIDILFGIGIFTFAANILKPKIKSDIPGIDFLPYINTNNNVFSLTLKNQSNEPIYLYRAYIQPGYYTDKINKTNLWTLLKSIFIMTWMNDKFPLIINHPLTTKGLYVLQTNNNNGLAPTIFIEPYRYDQFILEFDRLTAEIGDDPNLIFNKKQFGMLYLNYVHGTNSGQLVMQL